MASVKIHFRKDYFSEIMEQYSIYIDHLRRNNQPLPIGNDKFLKFCNRVAPKLLDFSKPVFTIELSVPTIQRMYTAMKWSKSHVKHTQPQDIKMMFKSLNILQNILKEISDSEQEHANDAKDNGLYKSKSVPAFTINDVDLIAKAVNKYLPVLAHHMDLSSVDTEIALPRNNHKILDADSLWLVNNAMNYEHPHIASLGRKQRKQWYVTQEKIHTCLKIINRIVLKRLAKISRIAKHSFIREALDLLYGQEISHNIHLHRILAKVAVDFTPTSTFISIKKTLPTLHKLIQPNVLNSFPTNERQYIKSYTSRLSNMKKRGYKYVIANKHKNDDSYSLHHVTVKDVIHLTGRISKVIKKELNN